MNEDDVFATLRAANWTDEDLSMLKHAIKYDRRIHYEAVIDMLAHFAESHENQHAAKALRGMCEFTLFIYQGIQRARMSCNNPDERVDGLVKFFTERTRRAIDIEATLDAKFKLLHQTQQAIDAKGTVH